MAETYLIDVNKIYPKGTLTNGLYVTNSSGTRRESFYAVRGTGSSNIVIYDKVLYSLTVNTPGTQEPNAHSGTFTYTSTKKHGNGSTENTSISPTTYSLTANTSTTSTKTTTITVYQANTANGTTRGNSVNITITQAKDYPVSIALALNNPSDIPASGGTVSSTGISSVKVTYKSGNVVTITSGYTISWSAAITANSLAGTVTTSRTFRGTLTGTVKLDSNTSITNSASVSVYQAINAQTSSGTDKTNYTVSLTLSGSISASGGSTSISYSGSHKEQDWYTTTAGGSTKYTSGSQRTINDTVTITSTTSNSTAASAASRFSQSGNTFNHSDMVATTGIDRIDITAATAGASTTKYAATTNSATNHSEDINYVVTCSIGSGITAAGGSATISASAYHTRNTWTTYTSGYSTGKTPSTVYDSITTITEVSDNNGRFSISGTTLSHSSMGTSATTDSVTVRATGSHGETKDVSTSVSNAISYYKDPSFDASVTPNPVPAGGGTLSGSATNITVVPVYTSGASGSRVGTTARSVSLTKVSGSYINVSGSNLTVPSHTNTSSRTAGVVRVNLTTNVTNSSGGWLTGTKDITVTQAAYVPSVVYYYSPKIVITVQSTVINAAVSSGDYEQYQFGLGSEYDITSGAQTVSGTISATINNAGQAVVTFEPFQLIANQTYRCYFWFYTEKRLQLNSLSGSGNCAGGTSSSINNSHITATLGPNPSIGPGDNMYIDITLKSNSLSSSTMYINAIGMEGIY